MSIFDKFNNQGMGDREAFEELCCQLFESWGQRQMIYGEDWTYRNIRGTGGDGGIEAYWSNESNGDFIGLQAKWFRRRLDSGQFKQIQDSIDTALRLRPNISLYIVCIPHNLTSIRNGKGNKRIRGEDSKWESFVKKNKKIHPDLKLELWDEAAIVDHLQRPENEGRRRLWFDKSLVNPDAISLALDRALATLRNRYIPELADSGDLSTFLDNFYGTVESRTSLLNDIEICLHVCRELDKLTRSFVAIDDCIPDAMRESAIVCQNAVVSYAATLDNWRELVSFDSSAICEIRNAAVDYAAIEDFESHIRALKRRYQLYGHVDALLELIDQFRELPSEWELANRIKEAFSNSHALVIGDQGTGKTCGLANKAREYIDGERHIPIFIKATDINTSDTWFDVIAGVLGLHDGWDETALWQALSSTAAISDLNDGQLVIKAKVSILVDGLDENLPHSRWPERIRSADAITAQYPRIRFVYSSRRGVLDYAHDEDLMDCSYFLDDEGDVPAWRLFDRYIEHYSIDLNGHEYYRWLLRTPMELSMFCLAYEGCKITDDVSTCMTGLVDAEINRLEAEFEKRHNPSSENLSAPVRHTLSALAEAYLTSDKPLYRRDIGKIIEGSGVDKSIISALLNFLDDYGILYLREQPGKSRLTPKTIVYLPGTRHLWDYFMALKLVDEDDFAAADLLSSHQDAAEMYGVLLVERQGVLPLSCDSLINIFGEAGVRELTFDALSEAEQTSTERFRQWALDEMSKGRSEFFDVVNKVIVQVASIHDHPLGPQLLDEHLRSFATPIDRDTLWAVPRNLVSEKWYALYSEREALKHLPKLHTKDSFDQMPLLAAWGLASVSSLRRRHFRSELILWGLDNPREFAKLFALFCDCDDPQIREDMFGIAAEITWVNNVGPDIKTELASLVIGSVFEEPNKPGNRNGAIRHYGRLLIEHCCADGILPDDTLISCRPPYNVLPEDSAMPVFPDACTSERMSGYGPIHYDLARYVLVDALESAFSLRRYMSEEKAGNDDIERIIGLSADEIGCDISSFEGWAIAAAYQYLIEHGYNPDVLEGPINVDGYRRDGIDRKIRVAFDCADHGAKSIVMTVAEKYVWCARNEIFGYLADRICSSGHSYIEELHYDANGRCLNYDELLSFESPLFEATVTRIRNERVNIVPTFPVPFSCDDGDAIREQEELEEWIEDVSPEAATALFRYRPNVRTALTNNTIPVSLFAGDWRFSGKGSRVWAYSGIVDPAIIEKLDNAATVTIDGYDTAASFEKRIAISAPYISPIAILSAPWLREYDEECNSTKIADAYIRATPLAAGGVDDLVDIGDYWYRYPSRLLTELCGVVRTDGARYRNASGKVVFEDVSFGEPYRREFHALLADSKIFADALNNKGYKLIWYVTVQREANSLARERIPNFEKRSERSWIIWQDSDDSYQARPISNEYPEPERSFNSREFLKSVLKDKDINAAINAICSDEKP